MAISRFLFVFHLRQRGGSGFYQYVNNFGERRKEGSFFQCMQARVGVVRIVSDIIGILRGTQKQHSNATS